MKEIFKKIVIYILTLEAFLVLKKYKPKIVAVAGSVGKTSTKDALYTALSTSFVCRKTPKSFNSEIGVPLTILNLPNAWNDPVKWTQNIFLGFKVIFSKEKYPEFLILEIGADKPGDIQALMKYITPDISVVTRMGKVPVHVEFFTSVKELIKEDALIVKNLKQNGVLVLNADDEDVLGMQKLSKARLVTFGIEHDATIKGGFSQAITKEGKVKGQSMKIDVSGSSFPISVEGAFGTQLMYPILASVSVAYALGLNMLSVIEALKTHKSPPGRMKILEGVSETQIVDDTYNSSPVALQEGLHEFQKLKTKGKKIVVLGDMKELGKYTVSEHKNIGTLCKEYWFDAVYLVGDFVSSIKDGAIEAGYPKDKIFVFKKAEELASVLPSVVKKNDIVYLKASQSIRLEKVVYALLKDKENAKNLLVRQEDDWKKR